MILVREVHRPTYHVGPRSCHYYPTHLFDVSADESDELDDELIKSAIASARITSDITPSSSSSSSLALLLLPSDATSSALAKTYRDSAFQTLADQVRNSVRLHPGNGWMFDTVNVTTTPLRFIDDILPKEGDEGGRGVASRPTPKTDGKNTSSVGGRAYP